MRKYAGQGVHVDIVEWWSAQGVTLTISDDGRGASAGADGHRPGYGLIGMNERVTSLGGTLQAGPRGTSPEDPAHGFSLTAVIPLTNTSTETDAERSNNFVERISVWTQSHFAVIDLIIALSLAILLNIGYFLNTDSTGSGPSVALLAILDTAFCLPLAMRRTKPQLSAAVIAGLLILSLAIPSSFLSSSTDPTLGVASDGSFIALISLYSVMLYGPRTARRWVYPTSACIVGLAVVNIWRGINDSNTRYSSMTPTEAETAGVHFYSEQETLISCIGTGSVIAMVCLGIIFFALWRRAKGADIVLLRAREDALLQQRDRQAALAANLERARISEQIQQEVTHTLGTVLNSANSWLTALQNIAVQNMSASATDALVLPQSDKDTIAAAFSDIATTGRRALAQMRELLGILRQNETPADAHRPQLSPIMEPTPATQQDGTAYHDDFSEHS